MRERERERERENPNNFSLEISVNPPIEEAECYLPKWVRLNGYAVIGLFT